MTERKYWTLLLLAAFVFRLGCSFALRQGWQRGAGADFYDGIEFDRIAMNLASGRGYSVDGATPTAFRAPGFPLLLAGLYGITGGWPPVSYWLFALLGAAGVAMAGLIASEVAGAATARWAGAVAAVYFPALMFATQYASENLAVPVTGLAVWLFLRKRYALAGLACGATALARPFALLLAAAFAVLARWRGALVLAMCAAVVAPWTLRNVRVMGSPVLIAANGGSTFFGANNGLVVSEPALRGVWVTPRRLAPEDSGLAEIERDRVQWRRGVAWLIDHPGEWPALMFWKLARLALPDWESANQKYVLLGWITTLPVLALTYAGIARLRNPALDATMLATVVTALIFWGSPRFRDANLCVLAVYAGVACEGLRRGKS